MEENNSAIIRFIYLVGKGKVTLRQASVEPQQLIFESNTDDTSYTVRALQKALEDLSQRVAMAYSVQTILGELPMPKLIPGEDFEVLVKVSNLPNSQYSDAYLTAVHNQLLADLSDNSIEFITSEPPKDNPEATVVPVATAYPFKDTIDSVLRDQVGDSKLQVNLTDYLIKDYGMDSLDVIELIMAIEEELNITIPEDELDNGGSDTAVKELLDIVKKYK